MNKTLTEKQLMRLLAQGPLAITAVEEILDVRERLNNLKQLLCEGEWTLDGLVHADVVCMYINSVLNGADNE